MSNYELRYAMEEIPQAGPCRNLMVNGVWLDKPADAERYETPRDIEPQPKPHYITMSSSDTVKPKPSSKDARYTRDHRKPLPQSERISKAQRERERYNRLAANRITANCLDCGQPTGRNANAARCKGCAYKHKLSINSTNRRAWYIKRHGQLTGYLVSSQNWDIDALRAAVIAKRGAKSERSTAIAIGIAPASLRDLESGRIVPTVPTVTKLFAWLGVPPESFARGTLEVQA